MKMLLDEIFKQGSPKEIVVIRKDGKIKFISKSIHKEEPEMSEKPLFPISKERK